MAWVVNLSLGGNPWIASQASSGFPELMSLSISTVVGAAWSAKLPAVNGAARKEYLKFLTEILNFKSFVTTC